MYISIAYIRQWSLLIATLCSALLCHGSLAADKDSKKRSSLQSSSLIGEILPAVQPPLSERFASKPGNMDTAPTDEVPSFQKHVSPLFGKLGCNGRACHGSFQGQGGFLLSLFGYDFKADYDALMAESSGRLDLDAVDESLILSYPVDEDSHGGGKRFELGGWEYWVLKNWISAGAQYDPKRIQTLVHLEVTPSEILFTSKEETLQLQVIAHWEDGSREDVTALSRFHSNDSAIADIDEAGVVRSREAGDTHVVVSYDKAVVPIQTLRPISDLSSNSRVAKASHTDTPQTPIDRLVKAKLDKLGILPSELCTDEEFIRRATLDITGTLPTASEVSNFLKDSADDKRERKIEELLSSPGYAARWTTFLCDMTGNNDDQLNNYLPPGYSPDTQWYQWIKKRVEDNMPYDEIVEGIVTAQSREPGESYREYCEQMSEICRDKSGEQFAERSGLVYYWARRNFQTPEDRAIGFAYTFLGVRIQCAQCHKHPFDQWSKEDFDNFERLFGAVQARQNSVANESKREYEELTKELGVDKSAKGNQLRREFATLLKKGSIAPFPELSINVRNGVAKNRPKNGKGKPAPTPKAKLLGGDWVEMESSDARTYLMDWLRSPDNPYFAKAIVNRIWTQYFSVGIINPADDINLANAPSNAALLDYLTDGFRAHDFDMKWLHREILNSHAYQRSWQPNSTNIADKHNFSRSQLRRLPAETTLDAIRAALASDQYAERARQLDVPRAHLTAGASAKRLAGRDDTTYALNVFGRSTRESNCDCDRSEEPSLLQTVFLLNDELIQEWLVDPNTSWVNQVAKKYGWPAPRRTGSADPGKKKQYDALIQRLEEQKDLFEQRLQAARQRGQKKQVAGLLAAREQQVDRLRKTAENLGYAEQFDAWIAEPTRNSDQPVAKDVGKPMREDQAQWIAKEAYLRSLSREPTSDELHTSVDYLLSEDNPTQATAGLVWSLLNTKEFILNH